MSDDLSSSERRERLGPQSDNTTTSGGSGYTRFVKSMRLALPLLAGVIMIILFTYKPEDSKIMPAVTTIEDETQTLQESDVRQNELLNPNFESRTKDGKPYVITAARALQNNDQPDLIYMEELTATLDLDDTQKIHLTADDATYNQKSQFMTLSDNIVIETDTHEKLFLSSMEADLVKGEAFSAHPTLGESPDGTIEGQTMRVSEQGNKIIFTGPAKLTLHKTLEGLK